MISTDHVRSSVTSGASAAMAGPWVRDDGRARLLTLMAWTLILLMIVPENFDYASLNGAAPAQGGLMSRLLWLGLLGGSALIMVWRLPLALLLMRQMNPFLLAFAGLALLSVIWSEEPGVTLRRCIRVGAILFTSIAIMLMGWRPQRFQDIVRPALTAMLFGSLIFGLVSPTLAIHQETSAELEGAWRGLANHKNTLGALSCITLVLWVHAWLMRDSGPWRILGGCCIAIACLLLSRSSTSLVTAIFTLGLLGLLQQTPRSLRPYLPYIIALFVLSLVAYALAVLRILPGSDILLQPIFALTGKDPTFTGRSEIWEIINENISNHAFLGTGLGAYWTGPDPDSLSYEFIRRMHFYPGSAHNGYLEILNDLGIVGLLCLFGYLLSYLRQSLRLAAQQPVLAGLYLCLFLQQAVTNLSESHWLSVLSIGFVIMSFATASLARLQLDAEFRKYFGQPQAAAGHKQPVAVHA